MADAVGNGVPADALVCFINAHGGTVVLGVDDKATVRESALRGVPIAYSLDGIREGVFDRTSPPITPFVAEKIVDGVRLVTVTVPRGVLPHSNTAGLATRRLGKECLPFPPVQQREVLQRGHRQGQREAADARRDRRHGGGDRRRRGADGMDQKIIDHVREYGFVTNRTLQRLFDIQVYAARDLLNDLRARRILEKIGDARGGTGVRYGPGPDFPR